MRGALIQFLRFLRGSLSEVALFNFFQKYQEQNFVCTAMLLKKYILQKTKIKTREEKLWPL